MRPMNNICYFNVGFDIFMGIFIFKNVFDDSSAKEGNKLKTGENYRSLAFFKKEKCVELLKALNKLME